MPHLTVLPLLLGTEPYLNRPARSAHFGVFRNSVRSQMAKVDAGAGGDIHEACCNDRVGILGVS
jgi:hypothetical protein